MYDLNFLIDKAIHGEGDSDRHLLMLYSLVISSNAKNILELGVREGYSTIPLVLGAKQTNGIVYSVDIEPTPLVLEEDLQKYNKFILQDALVFLNHWDTSKPVDLIFLDDCHTYYHVKKELELIDKIISPKTIILLHDLMYEDTCPFYHSVPTLTEGDFAGGGPYRAVSELDLYHWEFSTLPWNNGLTVLRKKI